MASLPHLRSDLRDAWLPPWAQIALAILAVLAGLFLARLSLLWAATGLLVAALVIASIIDPLIGVGIALILGPTKPLTDYFVPQLPLDLGQISLIVTLGAWFVHAARRRRIAIPHSPFNLPLLLFVSMASLSLLNALSLGYALNELIKWAQLFLMMWLVIDLGGKRRWPLVVGFVLAAASIEALIGVWQFGLRGDGPEHFQILDGRFYRAYGTFEQPNPYAGFMGMALALATGLALVALERWFTPVWRAIRRRFFLSIPSALLSSGLAQLIGLSLLCGLLLAALLMSWSRGAWLGFGAAGLVMLFAWPRRMWIGLACVLGGLLLGATALQFNLLPGAITTRLLGFTDFVQTFDVRGVDITPDNFAVIERLAHWQAAQEMARYHPVLGVGLGNYEPVYPAYRLVNWPYPLGHAHNIYLNMLAETGILGLSAYLTLWVVIFWQTWRATCVSVQPFTGDVMGLRWHRGIALGLMGTWTHITVHQFLDTLYVANLHLHIGALLGVLTIILIQSEEMTARD